MVPIVWHLAQGFQVCDPYGNQWIDLSSGIVMANSGHAHPRILEAIRRQAASPLLFTYAYPAEVRRRLLERLVKLAPPGLNKGHPVFIGNRGQRVRHHADAAARPAHLAPKDGNCVFRGELPWPDAGGQGGQRWGRPG